jgi:hypothetical protein
MKQIFFTTLLLFLFRTVNSYHAQELPAFSRSDYYHDYNIRDFALGDFNSDGIVDIAAIKSEIGIAIFLGNGDGTFTEYETLVCTINNLTRTIVSDDFNCDGNLDLLINTSIFWGNGNGEFESKPIERDISGSNTISGDCNNDNIPDLIVGVNKAQENINKLGVFLGNGEGIFGESLDYTIPQKTGLIPVSIGDFNNDGNVDVVITYNCYIDEYGGTCKTCKRARIGIVEVCRYTALLFGNGDGTFDGNYVDISIGSPYEPVLQFLGDYNRDGNLDVLSKNNRFEMHLGNGEGSFQRGWLYERTWPNGSWANGAYSFIIDADQDSLLDIVSLGVKSIEEDNSETFSFMKGNGDGSFGEEIVGTIYGNTIEGIYKILVNDINQDNREDFIALNWKDGAILSIYLNEGITGVEDDAEINPLSFKLLQNYPNPFNQSTTIPFTLEKSSFIEIVIYDLLGQKVSTLISRNFEPGLHQVTWNSMDDENQRVGSGVYLYCLKANQRSIINKLIFMP